METLLRITCQIISELKLPHYCFPKFVWVWPAPEVVDGIFEVCLSAIKFCPLVNKPVALGFLLWWQIFDINKQFCPLVRLGPYRDLRAKKHWDKNSLFTLEKPRDWSYHFFTSAKRRIDALVCYIIISTSEQNRVARLPLLLTDK